MPLRPVLSLEVRAETSCGVESGNDAVGLGQRGGGDARQTHPRPGRAVQSARRLQARVALGFYMWGARVEQVRISNGRRRSSGLVPECIRGSEREKLREGEGWDLGAAAPRSVREGVGARGLFIRVLVRCERTESRRGGRGRKPRVVTAPDGELPTLQLASGPQGHGVRSRTRSADADGFRTAQPQPTGACMYVRSKGGIQGEERLGEKKRRRCWKGEKRRPRLPFSLLEAEARYFRCFGALVSTHTQKKKKAGQGMEEERPLGCGAVHRWPLTRGPSGRTVLACAVNQASATGWRAVCGGVWTGRCIKCSLQVS